jgi:hypothetical protein
MIAKTFLSALLGLATLTASVAAPAASILYQTRPMVDFTIPALGDYRGWWVEQGTPIVSHSLTSFVNVKVPGSLGTTTSPADDVFSHLQVDFTAPNLKSWRFQFAVDAGWGGALYTNDGPTSSDVDASDLWWNLDWNSASELLTESYAGNGLPARIDLYWAEKCCNGFQSARFSTDKGKTWKDLTVANLEAAAPVPLPAAIWLLGSAIAGLTVAGWRGHEA